MNTLLRRTSALAAATLVAGALTFPAGTAHAAATSKRDPHLASGAAWLSAQLTAGTWGSTYNGTFYPDMGAVIDTGYAALRAGRPAIAAKAADMLAVPANADSYVGTAPQHYAGPTAKALAFQQLMGRPTTLATHHLLTDLESMVTATGRIQDASAFGDYANTIGQAFSAEALHRVGSSKAASATRFLLTQQCKGGWFRLYFTNITPAATTADPYPNQVQDDTACDADAKATPDTDVTAYAILNLLDQRSTPAVGAALAKAVAWLKSDQKADGSFGGGVATEAPNSDSTGLAGWALGAAGAKKAAAKAATWVYRHQLRTGPDTGAIAYDDTALKAVTSHGIDNSALGQWRLATAQALPSLAYLPAAKVSAKPVASAHRGTVALRVTVGGKRFAGKVAVTIGKRKLHAKAKHGVAALASAKVFRGKTKVRVVVSFKGSATIAPFSDRLTLRATKR